jgi:hypothetical protein
MPFFAALPAFVQFHLHEQGLLYLSFADPQLFWAQLIYPHGCSIVHFSWMD